MGSDAQTQEKEDSYYCPLDKDQPPAEIPLKSWSDRYAEVEGLGSGSFGTVILARRLFTRADIELFKPKMQPILGYASQFPAENCFAVKVMRERLPRIRDYLRLKELNFIFNMTSHPNLLNINEIFVDNEMYHLRIVMEPMSQNLLQLMRFRSVYESFFSKTTLKSITSQLLAAVVHIHRNEFFHRDIKPENILLSHRREYYLNEANVPAHLKHDRYVVKLADYGLARNVHNEKHYTSYVSTRWYRAPEILMRAGFYSTPLDIWAFGCVLLECVQFKPLFEGKDEIDQLMKISKKIGTPYLPRYYDPRKYPMPRAKIGGCWYLAEILFCKLGFLPETCQGLQLEELVDDIQLQEVVYRCIQWDPETRATAEELCELEFFRDSKHLEFRYDYKPSTKVQFEEDYEEDDEDEEEYENDHYETSEQVFEGECVYTRHDCIDNQCVDQCCDYYPGDSEENILLDPNQIESNFPRDKIPGFEENDWRVFAEIDPKEEPKTKVQTQAENEHFQITSE